ncbi:hypothetical protein LX36DRAFT_675379 [Colletotrichum falcatum]|nr:hypothetical protein LX36DRAFT_675379 [Colletotrichum falcatum]
MALTLRLLCPSLSGLCPRSLASPPLHEGALSTSPWPTATCAASRGGENLRYFTQSRTIATGNDMTDFYLTSARAGRAGYGAFFDFDMASIVLRPKFLAVVPPVHPLKMRVPVWRFKGYAVAVPIDHSAERCQVVFQYIEKTCRASPAIADDGTPDFEQRECQIFVTAHAACHGQGTPGSQVDGTINAALNEAERTPNGVNDC